MTNAGQGDLFNASPSRARESGPAAKRERVDLFNEHARKIHGITNWRWFSVEAIDPDTILMKGAVCTAVYLSGRRKGQTNWKKRDRATERTLAITQRDHRAFCQEWEVATGFCSKCGGTGRVLARWSAAAGCEFRACARCSGSGNTPGTSVEEMPA